MVNWKQMRQVALLLIVLAVTALVAGKTHHTKDRPGGLEHSRPADESVVTLVNAVKNTVQNRIGQNFATFEPISYRTQVVAGINYFVKIHVGGGNYIHVRIYEHLNGERTVDGVQENKSLEDRLAYF
jgi:cystatin-A/B